MKYHIRYTQTTGKSKRIREIIHNNPNMTDEQIALKMGNDTSSILKERKMIENRKKID